MPQDPTRIKPPKPGNTLRWTSRLRRAIRPMLDALQEDVEASIFDPEGGHPMYRRIKGRNQARDRRALADLLDWLDQEQAREPLPAKPAAAPEAAPLFDAGEAVRHVA